MGRKVAQIREDTDAQLFQRRGVCLPTIKRYYQMSLLHYMVEWVRTESEKQQCFMSQIATRMYIGQDPCISMMHRANFKHIYSQSTFKK